MGSRDSRITSARRNAGRPRLAAHGPRSSGRRDHGGPRVPAPRGDARRRDQPWHFERLRRRQRPDLADGWRASRDTTGRRQVTLCHKALFALVLGLALLTTGCGGSDEEPTEVVLVTHDSFAISGDVKRAFEEKSGLTLRILKAGDAGEIVTRALLTAGTPEGDVLFGVDNNLLQRALDGDVFASYESPELESVDP